MNQDFEDWAGEFEALYDDQEEPLPLDDNISPYDDLDQPKDGLYVIHVQPISVLWDFVHFRFMGLRPFGQRGPLRQDWDYTFFV